MGLIAGSKKIQAGEVNVLGGDMTEAAHREAVCPRIAFMPQGLGKNLYLELSVFENIDFFARLFGVPDAEREPRIDALLDATGLGPFPDRPAGQALRRHEAESGPLLRVDPRPRPPHPRRADHRRRSPLAPAVLEPDRPHPRTTARHERAGFHRLHGRGPAIRLDDRHGRRAGPRHRHARAADGTDRRERTWKRRLSSLLPAPSRVGRRALVIPPRVDPGGEPAIQATDLTKRFGKFTAVDRVSFTIGRGEIFGFLGSNGCGKSTTMKMLTGLLPATEGEAKLFGDPVDANDLATRKRVGYMSQAFSLYGELTVRQNL